MSSLADIKKLLECASSTESGRDDRVAALTQLDALGKDRSLDMDKDLRHYLQNRSYEKALNHISALI